MRHELSDYEWGVIRPLTGSQRTASQITQRLKVVSGRIVHRYRLPDWQHAFNLAPKAKTPFPTPLNRGISFMTQ